MIWSIVGYLAATLTMFSFVPQIVKAVKTRSVKDISLITILQLASGTFLWIVYGVYRKDAIIITANVVTLTSMLIVLALYLKYGREKS